MVSIRVLPSEHALLTQKASERGLSVADYARAVMLVETPIGVKVRRRVTGTEEQIAQLATQVALLLAELGKIGSNINQVAHASNSEHAHDRSCIIPAEEIATLAAAVEPIRDAALALREAALTALRVNHTDAGE